MSEATEDDVDYCTRLVRRFDSDRYFASFFAPKELRGALLGLYAFNVELGLIRKNVTDPAFGEIRLQWWRDTLTDIFLDKIADNPVARALYDAVLIGRITKSAPLNMIDARTFDIYDNPMLTLNDLEDYLCKTASALTLMASLVLTRGEDSPYEDASAYAGIAYGLCKLLQSVSITIADGQCYLPIDEMERWELDPARIGAGEAGEGFSLLIRKFCNQAAKRLQYARDRQETVPAKAIPAFLPTCLVDLYLKSIIASGPNLLKGPVEIGQMRRQWHLLRFALKKEF